MPSASGQRFAAFLRGVSPMNLKMADLKACLEGAGFRDVRTVLSSGNAVFIDGGEAGEIERKAEDAMQERLGRRFLTIVRPVDHLREILAADPYRGFRLRTGAKRIVTFLREPPRSLPRLPIEVDGARILLVAGREAFSAYLPSPRGPVFMDLIERTFGKDVTTRTWDTVARLAK
jgi:uncharacterized protein (DUF1697 family)